MSGTSSNAKYGKKSKGTGGRYSETFKGFVEVPLSDKDRGELDGWSQPGQVDIEKFLTDLAEDGYKFSLAGDFTHGTFIATATGKSDTCENQGYALSGRGPSPFGAIVALWYKIDVLLGWGPWADEDGKVSKAQMPLWG